MPMKRLLPIIIGLLIWNAGLSCDCKYMGNFLKVSQYPELIVIVKVKQYEDYFELTGAAPDTIHQPMSATFEIIRVLKGKTDKKEIKVFGDDGALCRPYIDTFKKDGYYVVGLAKCTNVERENNIRETTEDYQIWTCGEYWIEYNPGDRTVKGLINDKNRKSKIISLDNLVQQLNSN
jgi:hypothetical protein